MQILLHLVLKNTVYHCGNVNETNRRLHYHPDNNFMPHSNNALATVSHNTQRSGRSHGGMPDFEVEGENGIFVVSVTVRSGRQGTKKSGIGIDPTWYFA